MSNTISIEMTPNEFFLFKIKCQNYKVCDELLAEHDKQIKKETLQEVQAGIENILRQYEEDKENVPKPSALSIYAYIVALGEKYEI